MHLSLTEAAQLLGKSLRQVRYLIQTGKLKAYKSGGHWVIAEEDLPVTEARREARQARAQELSAAVERALEPHLRLHPRDLSPRLSCCRSPS